MDDATRARLLEINREFYQAFAGPFSATRQRLQPGVQRVVEGLPLAGRILDLGCGNGELAQALIRRGQSGLYVGLDFSAGLLEIAQAGVAAEAGLECRFVAADLAAPDWAVGLPGEAAAGFDTILAFAVLHHLPGADLHLGLLRQVRLLLAPGGQFIHSNWQFLNSTRLRARILPWGAAGLSEAQVEPGDYLLDWRQGGSGLRYAHHFSTEELQSLAEATGFSVRDSFLSDGQGGQLGLYQVWKSEVK